MLTGDDPVRRRELGHIVEAAGFTVHLADGTASTVASLQCLRPDAVIVDTAACCGHDGDAHAALTAAACGEAVPVVLVARGEDPDEFRGVLGKASRMGITAIVADPVIPAILIHRLEHVLQSRDTVRRLVESESRFAATERLARLGQWEWEPGDLAARCSEGVGHVLGLEVSRRSLRYREFLRLVDRRDRLRVASTVSKALKRRQGYTIDHRIVGLDGSERVISQEAEIVLGPSDEIVRVSGIVQDITERRRSEKRIQFLAYFDQVTGLPNRALLRQVSAQTLANAKRYRRSFALLFVDLDHFKRINDTLGHDAGDLVLRQVSERFRDCVRDGDSVTCNETDRDAFEMAALGGNTVTRHGGDEFVVLLTEVRHPDHAALVGRRMIDSLNSPIAVGANAVTVSASIGIAVYPVDGNDVEDLIRSADAAMYRAKRQGRNRVHFFSEPLNHSARRRFKVERRLHAALERDELVLYYQPIVELRTLRVRRLEALLRWDTPSDGVLEPDSFLGVAAEVGLIVDIDRWVLDSICARALEWRRAGFDSLKLSMNVSPAQFRYGRFAASVDTALRTSGVPPEALEFDVSESLVFDDLETAVPVLTELEDVGVGIALDDFGAGRSSIRDLLGLPIDALKIDRGFVENLAEEHAKQSVVSAAACLARGLGIRAAAKGVERRDQLKTLRTLDCDEAQGFLFSRPLPHTEVRDWIIRREAMTVRVPKPARQAVAAAGR